MTMYLVAFGLGLILLITVQLRNVGRRPLGCPPGPPTLPIIGNLHQIPPKSPHLQFQKWAEEYGPMYSLILGTRVMIIVSSDQAIKDLFDKRSAIYSSRPEMYLAGTVASHGLRMALMEYGPTWRMIRKLLHNFLNINAARTYVPYQDLENKHMLLGFADQPELWVEHIRRYTNSLSTQMIFGFRTLGIDDPRLLHLFGEFEEFSELATGTTGSLLDVFPALRLLPEFLLPEIKRTKALFQRTREFLITQLMDVKRRMKEGTALPCFCVNLLKAQLTQKELSDDLAGYAAGTALEGGSDTTSTELVAFVQALLLYPEVQKEGQKQVDRVCGDRLPELKDEAELQYVRACSKETLRWFPTGPLGIPHSVIQDDEYMGYKIPKGASVVCNIWAANRDPSRYDRPEVFDPSRYLDDFQTSAEAATNSDVKKRDHFTFGVGRRVCQGMHLADRSMYLSIARLLWAFDFQKALDPEGNEITPDRWAVTEGLVMQPQRFPVKITPRSEERVRILRQAWRDCEKFLDDEKQWKELPKGIALPGYETASDEKM